MGEYNEDAWIDQELIDRYETSCQLEELEHELREEPFEEDADDADF